MPRYITKITDEKTGICYYLDWSTIVDAPVTYGMSLEEFKEYHQQEYRTINTDGMEERLARVEANGTSSLIGHTPDDFIDSNRAGEEGRKLTRRQLINKYCVRKPDDKWKRPSH